MTINPSDIKLLKSERMTDAADAGILAGLLAYNWPQ